MRRFQTEVRPDDITDEMIADIQAVCRANRERPGSLIPVLQQAQDIAGYLPNYLQDIIAAGLGLPRADVYGVVTFYSYFSMVPRGRHVIKICMGTACFVKGANEALNRLTRELKVAVGETTEDRRFTLEAVRCLGACGLAPVTVVDEDTHRQLTSDRIIDVIAKYD